MQDRYAGDIGDYGKIGLLKCLQARGFTIGINWYRISTPESEMKADGSFKQKDGKHLISDSLRACDPALADTLTKIAKSSNRSVMAIQEEELVPNAVNYDEYLTLEGRSKWHAKAMKIFESVELVFMDPDNGLLVKSVGKRSARSIKYAFYEEVKDYIDSKKSVLVYNHRCRKPERKYFDDIEDRLQEKIKVKKDRIQKITFSKGTIRDYFAISACKEHYDIIHDAFAAMMNSKWGQLGVCRR